MISDFKNPQGMTALIMAGIKVWSYQDCLIPAGAGPERGKRGADMDIEGMLTALQ